MEDTLEQNFDTGFSNKELHPAGSLLSERSSKTYLDSYLKRLAARDNVWIEGKKCADLTKEKNLSGIISLISEFYRNIDEKPDKFCIPDEGSQASISLLVPRKLEDLAQKRRAYRELANQSFGLIGRTPDFMNAAVTAIYANADKLGRGRFTDYAENARSYYRKCCLQNRFVSLGVFNPQIDRSKSLSETKNKFAGVRVVATDSSGITVTGAKMIVTLGPLSDEILVANTPGLKAGDEAHAVAFVVPADAKGIRLICRKTTIGSDRSWFDHPLANSFDEIDALMIMDQVHVPWDHVFVFDDVELSNSFYISTNIRSHTGHQSCVRGLSKIEFVAGIVLRIAKMLGLSSHLSIQEQLGHITSYIDLTRAAILQSEQEAMTTPSGVLEPNLGIIQALRLQFPQWYRNILATIQKLSAASMMSVSCEQDFHNENSEILDQIFGKAELSSRKRNLLLNLAWDISGTEFGQRQAVYEMYHAGDPMYIAADHYQTFKKSHMDEMVERAISHQAI